MKSIPQLPALDLDKTRIFYEALGFSCGRQFLEPTPYLIMVFGEIELHFWLHKVLVAESSNASCYIRFDDEVAFQKIFDRWQKEGLASKGIPRLTEIEVRPWGMKEFYLIDLNGNLINCGIEDETNSE